MKSATSYNILPYSFFLIFVFGDCSSGDLLLIEPIQHSLSVSSISFSESQSTVPVSPEARLSFQSKLKEFLHNAGFQESPQIAINYRFIQFKDTDRWRTDPWSSLAIEATFIDPKGTTITIVRAECSGRYPDEAAERAADLIAQFAAHNFLRTAK